MKKQLLMMLAGIVLFAACKNSGKYEAVNNSSADTVAASDNTTTQLKLIKTAGIGFKVKSVQQSSEKIVSLTTRYKGMVVHRSVSSTVNGTHDVKLNDDSVMRVSAFNISAQMTVRVPSENLEEYVDSVGRMGIYVTSSELNIEDKSLDYLSARMKLKSRRELVNQQKTGKVVIKDPSAVLNLKDDLVDEQIDNRKIDDAVKYSVVNLSFYQSNTIIKEVIANDNPSSYSIPFFKQLGLAFENGWYVFKEVLILIADMWVFIVVGAAIWLTVRFYKRKARLATNAI